MVVYCCCNTSITIICDNHHHHRQMMYESYPPPQGLSAIVHTNGNPNCHVILRGGMSGKMYFQNYDADTVSKVASKMEGAGQIPNIMIDMSHANSCKDHKNQPSVCKAVCKQVIEFVLFVRLFYPLSIFIIIT